MTAACATWPRPPRTAPKGRPAALTAAQVEIARGWSDAGTSYREIAARFGVSAMTISRALADLQGAPPEGTSGTLTAAEPEQAPPAPALPQAAPVAQPVPRRVVPPGHALCGYCSAPVSLAAHWLHPCLAPNPDDDEPPPRHWLETAQW